MSPDRPNVTDVDGALRHWTSHLAPAGATEDTPLDYGQATAAQVLAIAHLGPDEAATCAILERTLPRRDEAFLADLDRLAGAVRWRGTLPCGHQPLPQERLRQGAEHWCPTCARWWTDVSAANERRRKPPRGGDAQSRPGSGRRMGDFVVPVSVGTCLCDHDYDDHECQPLTSPCQAEGCGCADFESDDPDDDWTHP